MSTEAQIQANRQNAQKSTGPRTPEGKAAVSQNALKHGLRARHAVIVGEDPGQFETHRDQLLAELAPQGPLESALAHRAVGLAWRLQRAERLQNEAFDALHAETTTSPLARLHRSLLPKSLARPDAPDTPDLTLGRIVAKDFASTRVLDRLLMYERRLEHSLYKTLAELQRLRLLRQINPPTEDTTAPAPPDRAKQTQFTRHANHANHQMKNRLQRNHPLAQPARTNPNRANWQSHPERSRTDLPWRGQPPRTVSERITMPQPQPDSTMARPFERRRETALAQAGKGRSENHQNSQEGSPK